MYVDKQKTPNDQISLSVEFTLHGLEFFFSHVICMVAGGMTQEEKYTGRIQHGGAMRIFL